MINFRIRFLVSKERNLTRKFRSNFLIQDYLIRSHSNFQATHQTTSWALMCYTKLLHITIIMLRNTCARKNIFQICGSVGLYNSPKKCPTFQTTGCSVMAMKRFFGVITNWTAFHFGSVTS